MMGLVVPGFLIGVVSGKNCMCYDIILYELGHKDLAGVPGGFEVST